ncbi:MAG: hypothetical protein CMF23_04620 [Ignavibacteriae bacterium]|nr:hypothetical protein [Ignavibacteriota bacterium]
MASPQTENGFTKIANEILEEIIKTDFSKRELKIIFAVVRFTYGFNRKEAELSIRYLSTYTGINFQHINKTLTDLQHKNVISFNEPENHSQSRKIKFNKNYSEWNSEKNRNQNGYTSNKNRNQNSYGSVTKTVTETVTKTVTNKERYKERINKEGSFFLELVPSELKTDSFLSLWKEWINYRKELKKPIKETTAKKQLKFLALQSEPELIIEKSIMNSWQGLFPLKNSSIKKSVKETEDDDTPKFKPEPGGFFDKIVKGEFTPPAKV